MTTTHKARDYQDDLSRGVRTHWGQGARNVLAVLPTGGGKSFVVAREVSDYQGAACVIAHRGELVTQLSTALAREGVRHRVVGPDSLRRSITAVHMEEFNRSFYDPGARVAVASVNTLALMDPKDPWVRQVGMWVQDECHHVLAENLWGKACKLFPNAFGLGVTATPLRADGKGLGSHADGLFDAMVVGPSMRELIERGYLSEYRVFAPPSDIDLSKVTTTDSGDFSPPKLREARRRSHITGDVVKHYLRIAPGKLGVTFEVDIDSATETAAAYRAAGVTAEVVSSKTPEALRRQILRRFRAREVLQLVNVDLFGEGFDLPAIEVVSMARPTMSYGLFCQQFGRALRPLDGKTHAIIIDHVSNVIRHRLPDAPREWSLDRRERRARSVADDAIPLRTCLNEECVQVYERVLPACPFCGFAPVPADRSAPEFVDGDLLELDPAVLAALRGEAQRLRDEPAYPSSAGIDVRHAIFKRHSERRVSQSELERTIALWAGWQEHLGRGLNETYRRFYHRFGVDIATAQTLGTREAYALIERVAAELQQHNVLEISNANPVA